MSEKLRDRTFDESWKKVLGKFFWEFLGFYFPKILEKIDTKKDYIFLDQELAKITKNAVTPNRRLDKLVKIFLKTEEEVWLLIHVEIQSYHDNDFELRMWQYFYRIFDLYEKPIASLAILTDKDTEYVQILIR